MATTPTSRGAAALALAALAAEGLVWAIRAVVVPALALVLTLAGYRPSKAPAAAPAIDRPAPGPLAALPVRELRQLARAAGLKKLARSGRRAELLLALA